MGVPLQGGLALEVGCGRGVGTDLIIEMFGADRVDAFDLDPRMVRLAQRRARRHGAKVNVWAGDVTAIPIENEHYDAVFDFGILHHVPNWRDGLSEIYRVLKPCGRFFAEEVFGKFINRTPWRQLLEHPREDRFNRQDFETALATAGFRLIASSDLRGDFGWFVSSRPAREESPIVKVEHESLPS